MVCSSFLSGTSDYFHFASTTYSWLIFNQYISVLMPSTCVDIVQIISLVKKIKNVWGCVKVSVQNLEDGSSHCNLSALCKRAGGYLKWFSREIPVFHLISSSKVEQA